MERLRHHVTGAVERGEAKPIVGIEAPSTAPLVDFYPLYERAYNLRCGQNKEDTLICLLTDLLGLLAFSCTIVGSEG